MITKPGEKLASYTTFKIGGKTPMMHIPENQQELLDLIAGLQAAKKNYYILGNGSNILIDDKGIKKETVNMAKACKFINFKEGGEVEVGASVKLAEFIRACIDKNMKIFFRLITIPGTVGGALCMNAGRNKQEISDNLISVKFFDGKEIKEIGLSQCAFSHRDSIFRRNKNWIILSAKYHFENQDKEEGLRQIKKEMRLAQKFSYFQHPSAGSIFKDKHDFIMKILKGVRMGNAQYSKTDDNAILNLGDAKSGDVMKLINLAKFLHLAAFQKCSLEIDVWD